MSTWTHTRHYGLPIICLTLGYIIGQIEFPVVMANFIQDFGKADVVIPDETEITISNDSIAKIQQASEALSVAMESLRFEDQYTPATTGMNPYLILNGGGDAIEDLELGIGVDPITFTQLYMGQAVQEIEDDLSKDELGRLVYKGKLVRIYSRQKLVDLNALGQKILEKRVLP